MMNVMSPERQCHAGWFEQEPPYEYAYFKNQMQEEFPEKSAVEVAAAILTCCKEVSPEQGQEKLQECVRLRLGGKKGGPVRTLPMW